MGVQENTDLTLDKCAGATMVRVADDLDVPSLSVGREMIMENADQLSVIHCGWKTFNKDASLVRVLLKISATGVSGVCKAMCRLRYGDGRGRQFSLRDGPRSSRPTLSDTRRRAASVGWCHSI